MQTLGVPYPEGFDEIAVDDLLKQAQKIVEDLKKSNIEIEPTKEMVAMIAYMHKLGRDIAPPIETIESEIEIENKDVKLLTGKGDLDAGKKLFAKTCVACHGADGKGIATFPNLTDDEWLTGESSTEVFNSILNGNITKGMVPYKDQLSEKQITQLTSYILITLQK